MPEFIPSARIARYVELDGRRINTASPEWQLICLARHVCRLPTGVARKAFVEKLGGKSPWSAEAKVTLQQLTRQEWIRMYPETKTKNKGHDNA